MILTTFIPTIILNVIGHMSNYFKEFFFEGLMGLNVTVMLVLTTMFLSVSTNLPPTAYIKMIDCWLIFSLLKPFMDIIVQTYIQTLRPEPQATEENMQVWRRRRTSGDKNFRKKICLKFLRVVYPVFFMVFLLIFWLVGLSHYSKN